MRPDDGLDAVLGLGVEKAAPRPQQWVFDDGGRAEAGFQGRAGDCFTRAVAIASQRPYREIYDFVNRVAKDMKAARRRSSAQPRKGRRVLGSLGNAREGVRNPLFHEVMRRLGWSWNPTMRFGQGCKVHLCAEELPPGRLVVRVTKHMVAVVDGVVHDTYDPSRCGSRCVYGYFKQSGDARCPSSLEPPLAAAAPPRPAAPAPHPPAPAPLAWTVVPASPPLAPRPWVQSPVAPSPATPATPATPAARSAAVVLATPGGGAGRTTPRRVVTEEALATFVEVVRGFSDDDSDSEVRHRCRRRRARLTARSG